MRKIKNPTDTLQSSIIFDGDNTLWDIEHLYDEARDYLCNRLSSRGHTYSTVEKFQRTIDTQLFNDYKYSPERFPTSFIRTVIHFEGEESQSLQAEMTQEARKVFTRPAKPNTEISHVLETLSQLKFQLILLTAGSESIQEKRILDFPFIHWFSHTCIVDQKSSATFLDITNRHRVDLNSSWAVGDSLNSDVIPALEAGLNVMWFTNHNWKENENLPSEGFRPDHPKLHIGESIRDIITLAGK